MKRDSSLYKDLLEILISEEQIHQRVQELGQQIIDWARPVGWSASPAAVSK